MTTVPQHVDIRHVREVPEISEFELGVLRLSFEKMMSEYPLNHDNFARKGGSYHNRELAVAWHSLLCGYMAAMTSNRKG